MATYNSTPYVDFKNICAKDGRFRIGADLSAAPDGTADHIIYTRSASLYYWNGTSETNLMTGAGGGASSWDSLYDLDQSMTIDSTTVTFTLTHATGDGLTLATSGTTTGNVLQITQAAGGSGKDINGTSSTWSVTKAGALVCTSIADSATNGTLAVDGNGSGGVDICSTSTGGITLGDDVTVTAGKHITMGAASVLTITGDDAGISALVMTEGDLEMSDGRILLTNTEDSVSLTVVGSGATTNNLIDITGAFLTAGQGILMTVNALTEGYMFKGVTTASGLTTGGFLLFDDGAARFAVNADGATSITTGVNSTVGLLVTGIQTSDDAVRITTSGVTATAKASLQINPSGNLASGSSVIRLAPSGTPNAGAVGLRFVGSGKVMQAMDLDSDPTGASVAIINSGGAMTSGFAALKVSTDGNIATGASTLLVSTAGTPASGAIYANFDFTGITDTNENIGVKINAGGKKVQALYVDADPVAGDVALFHTDAVIADNKALLSLDAAGAIASGANVLRVAPSGTPDAASIGIEFVGAGKLLTALYVDADPTASSVAQINGGGALTSDLAVLVVSSDGALATGSNTFRVDTNGTPASGAIYAEFDFAGITDTNENVGVMIDATAKKVQALKIAGSPLAGSLVLATAAGALAADKAALEVVSSATGGNADSSALRVEQSHLTGASYVVTLKQVDLDVGFINFEGTATADSNSPISTHGTGTVTDFVRCSINGTLAWIPVVTGALSA